MTPSEKTLVWLSQLLNSLEQELEEGVVTQVASMSRAEIGARLRSLGVEEAEIPENIRQMIYSGESDCKENNAMKKKLASRSKNKEYIVPLALAAAEGQSINAAAELDLLGNLVIDGVSYEISENEKGYICFHGAIPPDVTHLCLDNILYPLEHIKGKADLHIVLIGAPDMGEFLDKHDANPENYPVTFERNEQMKAP